MWFFRAFKLFTFAYPAYVCKMIRDTQIPMHEEE